MCTTPRSESKPFANEVPNSLFCRYCVELGTLSKDSHARPKTVQTEGAGVVPCGWKNHSTNAETVRKPTKKQKAKIVKACKHTKGEIKNPSKVEMKTQNAVENAAKNINKRLDEPYKSILAFLETTEVIFYKNIVYQVVISFGLNLS